MWCFVISVLLAVSSTCTDALPAEPFILYSNITDLHSLDLVSYDQSSVLGGHDRIIPLGVDTVQRHVYFGDSNVGRIFRSNYDGSSVSLIMEKVEKVEGLAVDWINRLMYWTTYTSGTIEVSTLDGMYRTVLINTGVEYPRGMAVDPIAGYLFWSDWGAKAAIEKSSLDGSNRVALVTSNITWPNGVTLDTSQKLVYWIDAYHDTISSVDYNGNNRRLIFEDTSLFLSQFHGFDLDINGDNLYFTDWLANAIYEIKISSGALLRTIAVPTTESIKGAMGLRVIDSTKQQTGTSNCGNTNGGCEQLCFHMVPTGISCKCQIGMKLASDSKSCVDAFKDEFIMFADADAGEIYQMQLDSIDVKPIPISFDQTLVNVSRPVALDYDSRDERVYWTDVILQTIGRSFKNGSQYELLYDNIGVADGLAIDFAGRLLYWTSTTNDTVEVSKLDGSLRRTLIEWYLDEPRDIIVDPIGGYMYWTDWGNFPRIERAYMNGENRHDLVNTSLQWPNGLTIDHVYNKLYWADAREDNIEVMDLETLERKVVLNQKILLFGWLLYGLTTTEVNHPYGLTLLHDKLYWTDWYTDAVYRADVNTGANIVLMSGNLGRPMDIHAYISVPKQQKKILYTFSFPNNSSNFTCIRSRSCPSMDPPPTCPPGYTEVRENKTCGLNCRDIVGYTWRCPCDDWMSCAVKERYLFGCASGYYSSFRVRECEQVVRPGRCPSSGSQGSQQSCHGDTECPNDEKCCNSKCATIATIETHPCQTNNGGCDQLCFSVPGGRKCGCRNGLFYDETSSKCLSDTEHSSTTPTSPFSIPTPTPTPTSTPSPESCVPHPAPSQGSVTCDGDPVPDNGGCYFSCDSGYDLLGFSQVRCDNGVWTYTAPTCNRTGPAFSSCPIDTTVPTDPGKPYATVNWNVPTATDTDGTGLSVKISPMGYDPPVKLGIGLHNIQLRAIDEYGLDTYCYFSIAVEDKEPPSFNSTCPNDITLYTDNDLDVQLPSSFKRPTATDNARPPAVTVSGFPANSYFPIGRTVVNYTASDAAGLSTSCIFSVTVVNVCRGVTCTFGASCALDAVTKNSHVCICNTLCPAIYSPVCASDGLEYNNECFMNVKGCLTKSIITVVLRGKCGDCSTVTCDHGATCKVVRGVARCECDFSCPATRTPVCGSDLQTYDNECKMNETACIAKKDISVLVRDECGDCSTVTCDHGATCKVVRGVARCECDFSCPATRTPVCGSDLKTYDNECKMNEAGCNTNKDITVVVTRECDCDELNLSAKDFNETSRITCKESLNSNDVECTVSCKTGSASAVPNFLKLKCYNNKWIRENSIGKFVQLANVKSPPQCYKTKPKVPSHSDCESGYLLKQPNICVPCPPGSYKTQTTCASCDVGMYQDSSGQSSCKKCQSGTISTTTGAEGCYFNYDPTNDVVNMEFNREKSKIDEQKIRNDIAKALTNVCENTNCTFGSDTNSRRKRDTGYQFKAEDIIILSIKASGNSKTKVEIFVLDPSSTSPLPTKAYTSKILTDMILKINDSDLSYTLLTVGDNPFTKPTTTTERVTHKPTVIVKPTIDNEAQSGEGSSSVVPVAGGAAGGGVLLLVAVAVAAWCIITRRRRSKSPDPTVQYNTTDPYSRPGDQIESSPQYEDIEQLQLSFNNKAFTTHDPPPIYENRSSHVYETPSEGAVESFSTKDKLPEGAVVYIVPSKGGADVKPTQGKVAMGYTHRRSTQPNMYHIPRARLSGVPDAEPVHLRATDEPPQVFAGRSTSSILPNASRGNTGDASYYQNVGYVTREQSES